MANTTVKAAAPEKKLKKESQFHAIFLRFITNKSALFGIIIFGILVLLAILSPYLTPYDYAKMDIKSKFISPCWEHWFGTDDIGRDILTRVLYGGRYSLSIGFIAIGSSCIVGSIIGAFCGYYGGAIDNIVMRFLDIFQALPGMLLTITISAALGAGFDKTILALAIGRIPGFARMMRSSIMNVRGNEFIEAAEAIGCSQLRRIFKHAVPNALAPVIVEMTMGIANCVLTLSSLSYIGLGVQPPTPEWGAMLSSAKAYIRSYPYMIIFPGIFIALTVLSLNLAGDGLRDALDPKLKQ